MLTDVVVAALAVVVVRCLLSPHDKIANTIIAFVALVVLLWLI